MPPLETKRLLLRKLTLDDANDMFEYACEPDITKYVPWEYHKSIEDTLTFLRTVMKKYEENIGADWGIVLKESNKLIGTIGVRLSPENARAEIGYALSKNYWNKGITIEAMNEIIRFGFNKMDLNRIEARAQVKNVASQRVMIKAGMTYEGTIREESFAKGEYHDFMLFSILRKEYFERNQES